MTWTALFHLAAFVFVAMFLLQAIGLYAVKVIFDLSDAIRCRRQQYHKKVIYGSANDGPSRSSVSLRPRIVPHEGAD